MNLVFYMPSNVMDFDTTTLEGSLGGTETAATQLAATFAARGHRVVVFANTRQAWRWHGVDFVSRDAFATWREPCDAFVALRLPGLDPAPPFPCGVRALWLHDLPTRVFGDEMRRSRDTFDLCFVLSEHHRQVVDEVCGPLGDRLVVTRNGLDPALLEDLGDAARDRDLLLYSSRPERGLDHLIEKIMPRLWARRPSLRLEFCTYPTPLRGDISARVVKLMTGRPGRVRFLGHLGKRELYQKMARARLLVYPTPSPSCPLGWENLTDKQLTDGVREFTEISCITAMEAQACGLPVVCSARGALVETVAPGAGAVVPGAPGDEAHDAAFADAALGLVEDDAAWQAASDAARARGAALGWDGVAEQWERLFARHEGT